MVRAKKMLASSLINARSPRLLMNKTKNIEFLDYALLIEALWLEMSGQVGRQLGRQAGEQTKRHSSGQVGSGNRASYIIYGHVATEQRPFTQ